jgi:hypothetical protein
MIPYPLAQGADNPHLGGGAEDLADLLRLQRDLDSLEAVADLKLDPLAPVAGGDNRTVGSAVKASVFIGSSFRH